VVLIAAVFLDGRRSSDTSLFRFVRTKPREEVPTEAR